jgi:hypothetical protein
MFSILTNHPLSTTIGDMAKLKVKLPVKITLISTISIFVSMNIRVQDLCWFMS